VLVLEGGAREHVRFGAERGRLFSGSLLPRCYFVAVGDRVTAPTIENLSGVDGTRIIPVDATQP